MMARKLEIYMTNMKNDGKKLLVFGFNIIDLAFYWAKKILPSFSSFLSSQLLRSHLTMSLISRIINFLK